jgi:hypothetical protein
MQVVLEHDRCAVLHGDSCQLGEWLEPNSVDAIVTDPPAGVAFMSNEWDKDKGGRDQWIAWLVEVLQPAIAALKPGGWLLVWALPRTSHWTATALENAGLEIRDVHHHIFGTGFPKSLTSASAPIPEGSGTALKPAVEHWILARKPLDGTVGENYAAHGTGVLHIESCRIGTEQRINAPAGNDGSGVSYNMSVVGMPGDAQPREAIGRWPAHLTLEHAPGCGEQCAIGCPVRMLDEQSGVSKDGVAVRRNKGIATGNATRINSADPTPRPDMTYGGKGGASRFFYVAKGSRAEKDAGLEHLPKKSGGEATGREDDSIGTQNPRAGAGRTGGARNFHPTVKSIELMRWLIRLITPPGGTVLDPFAGSGTTGVAALAEGCSFIGCELTPEYVPILVGRLQRALSLKTAE